MRPGSPADVTPHREGRGADGPRHLVTGVGALLGGTLLAAPVVWWTAARESARATDLLNDGLAQMEASTRARVEAGELPAEVLGSPWETFAPDPVSPALVLVESLPLGAAALAGFLLAGRSVLGRLTATIAALLLVLWAAVMRLASPPLPYLWAGSVPPMTWGEGPMADWHTAPHLLALLPALGMAALLALGGLLARPAAQTPRHRNADVAVGLAVALGGVLVVVLDRAAAHWWIWTSHEGLAAPMVLLALVAWIAADAPATPVLAPAAMLAAATPYLVEGVAGMTIAHLGVAAAALCVVGAAGLRRPATRAIARLLT